MNQDGMGYIPVGRVRTVVGCASEGLVKRKVFGWSKEHRHRDTGQNILKQTQKIFNSFSTQKCILEGIRRLQRRKWTMKIGNSYVLLTPATLHL